MTGKELKGMKQELTKIFVVSAAIYYGICGMLSGISFVANASFTPHREAKAELMTDEQAITTSAPHRVITNPREFRINTDKEEHVVYLKPVRFLN